MLGGNLFLRGPIETSKDNRHDRDGSEGLSNRTFDQGIYQPRPAALTASTDICQTIPMKKLGTFQKLWKQSSNLTKCRSYLLTLAFVHLPHTCFVECTHTFARSVPESDPAIGEVAFLLCSYPCGVSKERFVGSRQVLSYCNRLQSS